MELNAWRIELDALYKKASVEDFSLALTKAGSHLVIIKNFVNRISDAVVYSDGLSETTLNLYKTNITTARSQVSAALTGVNTSQQTIASKGIALEAASNALSLTD